MATTQAQRATLFNTLAEIMGQPEAETLVEQLPPTGWDTMATKDDVRVLGATITAALTEGLAEAAKERAKLHAAIATGLAEAAKERAKLHAAMADGFAEAAMERAEIIKSQARSLYVTVSTVVLAAISIWIALLAGPGA
ncbi:MAG: hypothetical protein OXH67_16515 [Acidimicrobiaceae bacterium]|nr:hypothetical protein [Acidimicrobiaceae bacterium]